MALNPLVTGVGAVSILAASVLTNTLTFGTYGHFAKKRGWNSWKAGAMTGLVTGGITMVAWLVMSAVMPSAMQGLGMVTAQPIRGLSITQLPAAVGVLTAQRLSGVYMQSAR